MLTEKENAYLRRQVRAETWFLYFSMIGVLAALTVTGASIWRESFNRQTFVLVIVLLLHARGNLRQHKSAALLRKLAPSND